MEKQVVVFDDDDDDEEDALDSILETSVVELDAALQSTQQEEDELVAGLTEESIVAFSKQLPATPPQDLQHQQLFVSNSNNTDRFISGIHHHPLLDTVVSESTIGSPSTTTTTNAAPAVDASGASVGGGGGGLPTPPPPPTSGSCIKLPNNSTTASPGGPLAFPGLDDRLLVPPPPPSFFATLDLTRKRVGRWGIEEKMLFLYGFRKYGRKWKQIQRLVPCRYVHSYIYHTCL